jgi:hypothetical protein
MKEACDIHKASNFWRVHDVLGGRAAVFLYFSHYCRQHVRDCRLVARELDLRWWHELTRPSSGSLDDATRGERRAGISGSMEPHELLLQLIANPVIAGCRPKNCPARSLDSKSDAGPPDHRLPSILQRDGRLDGTSSIGLVRAAI